MNPDRFISINDGLEKYTRLIIFRTYSTVNNDYRKIGLYPLPIDSIKQFCCFKYQYFEHSINKYGEEIVRLTEFAKDIFEDTTYTRFLKFENEIPIYLPTKLPLILLQYYRMSGLEYPISLKTHGINDVILLTKKFIMSKNCEQKNSFSDVIYGFESHYRINKNGKIYKCTIHQILIEWYKMRIKTELEILINEIDHAKIKFLPISSYIKQGSKFQMRHNKSNIGIKTYSDVIKLLEEKIIRIDDVLIEELDLLLEKYEKTNVA